MKKIEKWVIEEKSKKAASKRASRMALVIQTPLWILMCALVIFTGFPSLLEIAFLVVVWFTVYLVSYDIYYGRYRKMFTEEAEKEEE